MQHCCIKNNYRVTWPSARTCYISPNYPHVIAVVRRVMSKEDAETHPLVTIVLSNWETAMDLWWGQLEAVTPQQSHSVLEALIGEANEAVAYLNSHPCLVLLDTSQVMLISQQFYQEHLSVWPMQSLKGLVHFVGAAGQMVPFLGYGVQSISFPSTKAGTDKVFQMLVLVVQDNQYNQSVPLILGTNLAKQCQDVCQQMGGLAFLQRMAVSRVWKQAYGALRLEKNFHARCASGSMKVCCTAQHPVTIAARQTVVLWELTHSCPGEITKVVVESLGKLQHNSTFDVTPGLVRLLPSSSNCRIPAEVTNISAQPITLPPKANLASLQVSSEVFVA